MKKYGAILEPEKQLVFLLTNNKSLRMGLQSPNIYLKIVINIIMKGLHTTSRALGQSFSIQKEKIVCIKNKIICHGKYIVGREGPYILGVPSTHKGKHIHDTISKQRATKSLMKQKMF